MTKQICVGIIITVLTVVFSIFIISNARADSLVCFYPGVSRVMAVYIEGDEPKENKELTVSLVTFLFGNNGSLVDLWNGDKIRFNGSVPCVKIEEPRGNTIQIKRFLNTIKLTDIIIYDGKIK